MRDTDNTEREYHVTLHATGKESGSGFKGFDSCRAYFFTAAPVGSEEFKQERQKAIDTFSGQQLKHGSHLYVSGLRVRTTLQASIHGGCGLMTILTCTITFLILLALFVLTYPQN